MPSREYYLDDGAKMKAHRAAYRNYIIDHPEARRPAGRRRGGRPHHRARDRAVEGAVARRRPPRHRQDLQPDDPGRAAPRSRRSSTGPQRSRRPGLGKRQDRSSSRSPQQSRARARSLPRRRSRRGRNGSRSASFPTTQPTFQGRSTRRTSASSRRSCNGVEQQRERWKRGIGAVNGALGEGVGEMYVKSHFPAESEAQMKELIGNLDDAYRERIANNQWMDEATRKAALEKLSAFEPRIGHPVKYIDYSSMKVGEGRPARQCDARQRISTGTLAAVALPQAGRSHPVGNVSADDQRLLQPAGEPDHLPGRDPSAAFLRSERRRGRQLRRDRRGDRPRDGPRLRRRGPQVRPEGQPARLVDRRRPPRASRARTDALVAQYNAFKPFPDLARQRQADPGREYRRPRRASKRPMRHTRSTRPSTASRR